MITWHQDRLMISTGTTCEVMTPASKSGRFFATDGLSMLSPDGTLLATQESDHVVRIRLVVHNELEWNAGGVLFACQKLSDAPIVGYIWSPDSKLLAVQQEQVTSVYQVTSWKNHQGQPLGAYRPTRLSANMHPMHFAPTGQRLGQAIHDGIALWDVLTGTLIRTIGQGHVTSLAWNKTSSFLALGKQDATIAMYSVRTGKLLTQQARHTTPVTALAWSPDGTHLISGDAQGTLHAWNVSQDWSLEFVTAFEPMPSRIEALAWSSATQQLAVLDATTLDLFELPWKKGMHAA